MEIGNRTEVVNGNASDQFSSSIPRSAIGIDDDGPVPGKPAQDPGLDGLHDRTDRPGVIVCGQAHENVYFAHVDQLAKKIIG
jgi:hypothetical protein